MCVIMAIEGKRPSDNMINRAWNWNDDGGGVAWRTKAPDGRVQVAWKKGIEDVEEMRKLIKSLPLPFIAHFRVASCGGIRPELTHPFPIDKLSPNTLEGVTDGDVLFHNGDWKTWDLVAREAAIKSNTPIPTGKWSDSRAIAWLCSIYGLGFMEFLTEQRGVAFGPETFEFFMGTPTTTGEKAWVEVEGIWCSNEVFMTKQRSTTNSTQQSYGQGGIFCRFPTCGSRDRDTDGYCPKHRNGIFRPEVAAAERLAANAQAVSPEGKKTESGGTQFPIPFLELGLGTVISLSMAERLHKQVDKQNLPLISKNMIKRIRKSYEMWCGGSDKESQRAWKELLKLSQKLTINGPVA